jgi:hypothetical protein
VFDVGEWLGNEACNTGEWLGNAACNTGEWLYRNKNQIIAIVISASIVAVGVPIIVLCKKGALISGGISGIGYTISNYNNFSWNNWGGNIVNGLSGLADIGSKLEDATKR